MSEPLTRIILVRHGQTAWNDGARFQGHLDSPLTARGEAQAAALAARVREEEPVAIYSSDLGRAARTAAIIAERIGRNVQHDARLRERCLGIFQGLCREEIHRRYPEEAARYYSRDPDYAVPGGESARERFQIGLGCLMEIAHRHPAETVLVVTHGGLVAGMFRHCAGVPFQSPRRFSIENAAFNLLSFRAPEGWMIETWGDTRHFKAV
jgi:probable phosphoglycerate mutase